jgi:hypothetical protein
LTAQGPSAAQAQRPDGEEHGGEAEQHQRLEADGAEPAATGDEVDEALVRSCLRGEAADDLQRLGDDSRAATCSRRASPA